MPGASMGVAREGSVRPCRGPWNRHGVGMNNTGPRVVARGPRRGHLELLLLLLTGRAGALRLLLLTATVAPTVSAPRDAVRREGQVAHRAAGAAPAAGWHSERRRVVVTSRFSEYFKKSFPKIRARKFCLLTKLKLEFYNLEDLI